MTDLPPPPPEEGQLPAMIAVPLNTLKMIGKIYAENRGIVRMAARMMGQKIPPELDDFFKDISSDDPNAAYRLEHAGTDQPADPYNVGPMEIPPPKIGERVLTQDIAQQAWELHYKHHWTFRQIAEYLTGEGYPVSHTTVSNYISEIDEDIEEEQNSKSARVKRALLITAGVVGPTLLTYFTVHFLRL